MHPQTRAELPSTSVPARVWGPMLLPFNFLLQREVHAFDDAPTIRFDTICGRPVVGHSSRPCWRLLAIARRTSSLFSSTTKGTMI